MGVEEFDSIVAIVTRRATPHPPPTLAARIPRTLLYGVFSTRKAFAPGERLFRECSQNFVSSAQGAPNLRGAVQTSALDCTASL
jgi:hypothetical protein